MKYESRRCQTATYLSEVNSFSRAKYTDLKYVKRKKQYTSNSRTTFTTPINTETDLIIPNYIESESKMKNYLYMRNKRIKSGNRCYLRYPKLVKFTSDNSKEKLKAHFRPETARLNVQKKIQKSHLRARKCKKSAKIGSKTDRIEEKDVEKAKNDVK